METNTTITLKEILSAIKTMQAEELAKIQSVLNTDTHSIFIDVSVPLGEDFKHVKVNPTIVGTLKDWPKSVPSYDNSQYRPWSYCPNYEPLNPWKITSDIINNSTTCVILNEDTELCHQVNISGCDYNSFYSTPYDDLNIYANKL